MMRGFIRKNGRLPLKLPKHSRMTDLGDPKPGRGDHFDAGGIFYLGNDMDDHELWLTSTDMKTHMLVYGTTGSGKSVSLQSIAYNAFVMGTGLCYIDPKGDPDLVRRLFLMARRVSREDDFLVLDFQAADMKNGRRTPSRAGNTINPLAGATADAATNLLLSLLPKEDGGRNSVFRQKATALLGALVPVLCALRDAKADLPLTDMSKVKGVNLRRGQLGSGLDIGMLRDYLDPAMCASLVYPLKGDGEPEECDEVAKHVDKPLLDVLRAALSSLNYVPEDGSPRDQQTFLDQFGCAKGYFGAPLASLSGMYGRLLNVSDGEADMYDILFNRRVLVSVLPSLEKSPQECENLGKIILASVKNSVSGGLGSRLEGRTKEIAGALPSASETPGIIIVDEYAAIMMPGFEVILTQARSLGFMAVIASQDYAGMREKDRKSCEQIIENTKTKLFMKMTSAKETWDLAKSLFGEISVEERNPDNPENRGAIRSVGKVSQFDLMDQIEGEFHAFYKGSLIHGRMPPMTPESAQGVHHFRINRFIRTDRSPEKVRRNLERKRKS